MKIFQGMKDGNCEETDEVLLLFKTSEVKNIMQVLMQTAGDTPTHNGQMKFTDRALKAKAKKAVKLLEDVCF